MSKFHGLGLLVFLSFLLTACGDDSAYTGLEDKSSASAKKIEVSDKLDSGDYDYILSRKDEVTALDYAAAAVGKAGFDIPSLVDSLTSIGNSTNSNDLTSILAISVDSDALRYLIQANSKLDGEISKPTAKALQKASETEVLNFQKAITNLMTIVTAIAQIGDNNASSITGGFSSSDGITVSEAENLGTYLANHVTVMVDTKGDGTDTSFVTIVFDAVTNIVNSIDLAGLGSAKIKDTVRDATIGAKSIDYDGNGTISASDISTYLKTVIN